MKPKWIFGLFVVAALVQLAVPVAQIWKYEDILRTGTAYKFRTAPVDPYDAFRGRYVALNYADTKAPLQRGAKFERGAPAYIDLRMGEDGFARFGKLSNVPPARGDWLRVKYLYSSGRSANEAHFRLPFDHYFMQESKAPLAEAAYWKYRNRRNWKKASSYVVVRIEGGRGVIEDLYIKDKPVRQLLLEEAAEGHASAAKN